MKMVGRRFGFWRLLCLGLLLQASAHAEFRAPFYEAVRGKQVIYVLGTLHVGRADFYPLRPAIETALDKSSRLYLEIRLDTPGATDKLIQSMQCDHPCLKQALSKAEWQTLAERLGQQEAALHEIERMQPWAAAVVLTFGDYMALGLDPQLALENHVRERIGKNKQVIGLETADEQARLFTGMLPDEQKGMLVQWLNMTVQERLGLSRDLIRYWQRGDADALHAWYLEMEKRYSSSPDIAESFEQKFVVARNRVFVERMLPQIGNAAGPFFLAVGALHLGGPDGVLALLKKQGFKVEAK